MNLNMWYGDRRARAFCGRLLQSTVHAAVKPLLPVPLPAPLLSDPISQMTSYQQVLGTGYLFCWLQVLKCLFRSVFSSAEVKASLISRERSYTCRKLFWKLCLPASNAALDKHESLGPRLQAVLKGNWITACSQYRAYRINPVLQGIHWLPLGQERLFLSFSLLMYKLAPSFLVWLLLCSSNDQPTGNRPRV